MRAAVLGSPIAHSLSPVLHRAAYRALGLAGWSYTAVECTPPQLPELLTAASHNDDFGGYSLTMPLKVTAVPLVHALEPLAARVGAVNTVIPRPDGSFGLYGANTDVPGLVNALREAGVAVPDRPVVLGAGGSAQAAVAALALMGAPEVTAVVRNRARAGALERVAGQFGASLVISDWAPAALRGADLAISTVPASASDDLHPFGQAWTARTTLFDLVYAPWPTPLAAAVQVTGARVLGGLDLLVHQAVGQVALMTGRDVDVAVLRAAGERALAIR